MANAPDTPAAPAPTLWNSLVKPAVVLVLICAIVGFLLGSVDNLTLPTITANRERAPGRPTTRSSPRRPTSRRCPATCPA